MFAFFGVYTSDNRQTASLATANSHQSKKYSFQPIVILASWQIEAEYHDVKDNHSNAWLIVSPSPL